MSYESLYSLDHSVVFRETFANSFSVARNGGIMSATGLKFQNGLCILNSSSIKYIINGISNLKTISIRVRFNFIGDQTNAAGFIIYNFASQQFRIDRGFLSNTLDFIAGSGSYTTNTLTRNVWHEAILVWNNATMLSYLDGKLLDSRSTGISNTYKSISFWVGNNSTNSFPLNNTMIDLIEVHNRVLSAAEVSLIFSQNIYSNIY